MTKLRISQALAALVLWSPEGDAGGAGGGDKGNAGDKGKGDGQKGSEGAKDGDKGQAGDKGQSDEKSGDKGSNGQGDGSGKQGGAEGAGGDGNKSDDKGQSKAPEDYALTMPEGGYVDETDVERFRGYAKEFGWAEADTQAAIDFHAELTARQSDEMLAQAKADKEFGGKNLEQSQRRAQALLDRVRPVGHPRRDAILGILNRTGYGNHPEVLGILSDLGAMLEEDGGLSGTQQPTGGKKASDTNASLDERAAAKMWPGKS